MDNLDILVLRTLRDWQRKGQRVMIATVMRTWGSSPRPIGSIAGLSDDGTIMGSVSGGCIEDDLIDHARHFWSTNPTGGRSTELLRYGVSADEAHRFGLPCGGTIELLLEYAPDAESIEQLVAALAQGRVMRRGVRLADGRIQQEETATPRGPSLDCVTFTNTFGPEYRLLLIGAGQLAEYLATMALFSGFSVTVCDPREEHRRTWSLSGALTVDGMPDDVVKAWRPDARSAIVALTHDPKLDDMALMEALCTSAFYVGAIGSRRNNDARRQRLREHFDLTPDQLARLRGPIGVYIGSKTPAEIAVSVMAELLAAKNGVAVPQFLRVASVKNLRDAGQDAARQGWPA